MNVYFKMAITVLGFVFLLNCLCCNVLNGKKNTPLENQHSGQDTVFCMDYINQTSIDLALSAAGEPPSRKGLIKVEVSEVTNPDKYPIRIGVWLVTKDHGTEVKVGNFSLFPVDNPGNYVFDLSQYPDLSQSPNELMVKLELLYQAVGIDNSKVKLCVKPLQIEKQ